MTDEEILKATRANILRSGYVGLDLNMAAMCIVARRNNWKLPFRSVHPRLERSYDEKVAYWADRRDFDHHRCRSEQDVINLFIECHASAQRGTSKAPAQAALRPRIQAPRPRAG
jgi:hypothetical protein